jgi:hypothetical protein
VLAEEDIYDFTLPKAPPVTIKKIDKDLPLTVADLQ